MRAASVLSMRAASILILHLLLATCALCAPQRFTTDSNLEQFPTVIDPSRTSLFPDPPISVTIPRPPGPGEPYPLPTIIHPTTTGTVTFPTDTNSDTDSDSTTPSTTPTATQSLPSNPTIPVTPEPAPTDPGTGAALSVRAQPAVVLLLVAGVSAALL